MKPISFLTAISEELKRAARGGMKLFLTRPRQASGGPPLMFPKAQQISFRMVLSEGAR